MMSKEALIKAALEAAFSPEYLEVVDESHMHHRGEQTHYKVCVVSCIFEDMSSVKRHQKVYGALGVLMEQIHALALHTFTPSEWKSADGTSVKESPRCLGGSLHDF